MKWTLILCQQLLWKMFVLELEVSTELVRGVSQTPGWAAPFFSTSHDFQFSTLLTGYCGCAEQSLPWKLSFAGKVLGQSCFPLSDRVTTVPRQMETVSLRSKMRLVPQPQNSLNICRPFSLEQLLKSWFGTGRLVFVNTGTPEQPLWQTLWTYMVWCFHNAEIVTQE